jgi:hypothetical protein
MTPNADPTSRTEAECTTSPTSRDTEAMEFLAAYAVAYIAYLAVRLGYKGGR